jgi:hypothetical protein
MSTGWLRDDSDRAMVRVRRACDAVTGLFATDRGDKFTYARGQSVFRRLKKPAGCPGCKAPVLGPQCRTSYNLERGRGFEPLLQPWKGRVLAVTPASRAAFSIAIFNLSGGPR